jgi:hypothetical protein
MNELRWDGGPGHYEVYYLTLTDSESGAGAWIRYTMLAPLTGEATCSLWFSAMDPRAGRVFARKETHPIAALSGGRAGPFELTLAGATLTDHSMQGSCEQAEWDLRWEPRLPGAEHVHPMLARAGVAKTVLTLPHPDVEVTGTLTVAGRPLTLSGARGGQAHLWGSKHASRWAWAHCNDFRSTDGEPRPDTYIDGVSVFVPRFGREVGPSTPVVGRFLGEDFRSIAPGRILANRSRFALDRWHLETRDGSRRIVADVDAPRELLVGVTYTDPDGEQAYCYNSEVCSMRVHVWDHTSRGRFGWILRETLVAEGTTHFEYAQRQPLADQRIHLT